MDDLRTIMRALVEGTKYCQECRTLYHDDEQEKKDKDSKESDTKRTARVIQEVFNSIEKDLKFTMEIEEDFEDNMIQS